MKVLLISGSPRKNFNTITLLEHARQGAASCGAETELIHLYDYQYKGCISCFACKRTGNKTGGLCAYRDQITPILKKCLEADVVIMGAPVYFSHPSAEFLAFMERFLFPLDSYLDNTEQPGTRIRNLQGIKPSGLILTMNCPNQWLEKVNYTTILGINQNLFHRILGYNEILYAGNTYQFDDYSKYDCTVWREDLKAKAREEEFPLQCQQAYDLAVKLVHMAEQ